MDKSLLIKIFVPKKNSDKGFVGTGYPVGQDLILTAGHLVHDSERDSDRPIEVRWFYQKGEGEEYRTIKEVCWTGGENLDAALLRVPFPDGLKWGKLSSLPPVTHQKWETEGFAEVGNREDGLGNPVPIWGEAAKMAPTVDTFVLGASYPVDNHKKWRGASGSPVFVEDKIIGVITTCKADFNASRLEATPTWKLMRDKKFKEVLGVDLPKREEREKEIKEQLEEFLAVQQLAKVFIGSEDPSEEKIREAASQFLAKGVTEGTEEALKKIDEAYMAINKERDKEKKRVGFLALRSLTCLVLPFVYDDAFLHYLSSRKFDPDTAVISFDAAYKTIAEVIMAGLDGRLAEYKEEPDYDREGELALSSPPESGMDADGEKAAENINADLVNRFANGDAEGFKAVLHRAAEKEAFQHGIGEKRFEVKIQMVSDSLEREAKKNRTRYFLFGPDSFEEGLDEEKRSDCYEALKELKKNYPSVVFICLSNEESKAVSEHKLYLPLFDLLNLDLE